MLQPIKTTFFLTAIWLLHGHLWAIIEWTASFTFRFLLQRLNQLGHSPQNLVGQSGKMINIICKKIANHMEPSRPALIILIIANHMEPSRLALIILIIASQVSQPI